MARSLVKLVSPLRVKAGRIRKRVRTFIARQGAPVDAVHIETALNELISERPAILMMHSSLSASGYVPGGADTVIRAVEGFTQTLVMPTHTYSYPPAGGGPPPVFDVRETPSRVGKITEEFWRQTGTLRSVHPTHSLAARGPAAKEIVRDHHLCRTPCGRGTPYERLLEQDAAALMFGATMFSYTLFHTAEDAARCPYGYDKEEYELLVRDEDGRITTVRTLRQSMDERRFEEMDTVLERAGLLRRRRLGRGELLYIPSTAAVHSFLLERFAEDPYYLAAKKPRN